MAGEERVDPTQAVGQDVTEGDSVAIVTANEPLIRDLIYTVHGVQVTLDSDLARLYGVETRRLNENVKRNSTRFPESFCFQLTREEYENLMSQIATSSSEVQHGGRRKPPYAFTEQGVAMLGTCLRLRCSTPGNATRQWLLFAARPV